MKRMILALALLAAPALPGFAPMQAAHAASAALGDLTAYRTLAAETLELAKAGDLAAAEVRITDFETAWDNATVAMRKLDPASWTQVDQAADAAIATLRGAPDQPKAIATLTTLVDAFAPDDAAASAATPIAFSVTNPDGSPIPCEVALQTLRDTLATTPPLASDQAVVDALMAKGLERCNADDDKRADGFFAEAFAMLGH